eukprot:14874607-Ditylum_brightwellii.AAC.1
MGICVASFGKQTSLGTTSRQMGSYLGKLIRIACPRLGHHSFWQRDTLGHLHSILPGGNTRTINFLGAST